MKVDFVLYRKTTYGTETASVNGTLTECDATEGEDATEEVAALRRLLLECAEEIEADVKERYGWPDVHPAQKSKYDAEMELVAEAKKKAKGEE